MPVDRDHYEAYYADKLWKLLPAIYRTLDTDTFNANGPLRELVNRIGAQAGILRRSIDRLWEDQSIESCDDWVISYIADLLATNLVASLDSRGQRLDVAKTIYYRRRKGTVAILEEIASDITGWDARVVEFFRRLSRTRHNFDPPIVAAGETAEENLVLELAEGLTGLWSNTKAGGWADLRNVYGAIQAQGPFAIAPVIRPPSAFDEYFHTADFRAGRGRSGWYNIPNLGVFVWRLESFGVDQTTPVQNNNCFTFDPTGRQIPLFAVSSRALGDQWVSPQEWQLPTPISTPLLSASLADPAGQPLYAAIAPDGVTLQPNSMGIFTKPGSFFELIDGSRVTTFPLQPLDAHEIAIVPERGKFETLRPPNGPVTVTYHYGFSAPIGAGPYDRRVLRGTPNPTPAPMMAPISGGGGGLNVPGLIPPVGTVTVNDSLTYTGAQDVPAVEQLTIRGQNRTRPVIRFNPVTQQWIFTGNPGSTLVLEGLLVSGADIVLRGTFDQVTITCCTLDPGTTGDPGVFERSIDGRDLTPTRIFVEARVRLLTADRCILGPIRTRAAGEVETLTVTNSVIQGIPTSDSVVLTPRSVQDPFGLAKQLREPRDPLSAFLRGRFNIGVRTALKPALANPPAAKLQTTLVNALNTLITGPSLIYDPSLFSVTLNGATRRLIASNPSGPKLARLNRLLLELAYPLEFADLALGFATGVVKLSRCTVLGPAHVHRLEASECILDDVFTVEDTQNGCVRFSAWASGSILPRKYESAQIPRDAPLFQSRHYGRPDYVQLLDGVDNAIISADPGVTISAGAVDGSEMGVFALLKNPIKERSLLIKYQEFMPLGLSPIVIHVT